MKYLLLLSWICVAAGTEAAGQDHEPPLRQAEPPAYTANFVYEGAGRTRQFIDKSSVQGNRRWYVTRRARPGDIEWEPLPQTGPQFEYTWESDGNKAVRLEIEDEQGAVHARQRIVFVYGTEAGINADWDPSPVQTMPEPTALPRIDWREGSLTVHCVDLSFWGAGWRQDTLAETQAPLHHYRDLEADDPWGNSRRRPAEGTYIYRRPGTYYPILLIANDRISNDYPASSAAVWKEVVVPAEAIREIDTWRWRFFESPDDAEPAARSSERDPRHTFASAGPKRIELEVGNSTQPGVTATAVVHLTVTDDPGDYATNLPQGYTLLGARTTAAQAPANWNAGRGIHDHPAAPPRGGTTAIRMTKRFGLPGGSGPGNFGFGNSHSGQNLGPAFQVDGTPVDEVYLIVYIRLGDHVTGWANSDSNQHKMLYLHQHDGSVRNTRHPNWTQRRFRHGTQVTSWSPETGAANQNPNQTTVSVYVDNWVKYEWRFSRRSGPQAANGQMQWWVNGVKVYEDLATPHVSHHPFTQLEVAPIFGGGARMAMIKEDYMDYAHLEIWGRVNE